MSILLADLGGGGAERIALNLAKGIVERGYQVDLVVLSTDGPLLSGLPDGVTLVHLGTGQASRSLVALARYLRRKKPDLLISHLHAPNMLAVAAKALVGRSVRLAVTVHSNLRLDIESENHRLKFLFPLLMRLTYPRADAIIAVSNGVAASVTAAGIRSRHLRTIYNPVVSERLFEMANEPVDHPWLADGHPPLFLAVGRLDREKDHGTLLEAFATIRQKKLARLLILGEGPDRPLLEEQTRKLGIESDVAFPGFVPNPYPYMQRANVFVLSSRREGLPTALIEALALGTPIVSTDCPDGPREVLHGGELGRLVPVADVQALAHGMDMALSSATHAGLTPDSWRPYAIQTAVDAYLTVGR